MVDLANVRTAFQRSRVRARALGPTLPATVLPRLAAGWVKQGGDTPLLSVIKEYREGTWILLEPGQTPPQPKGLET
ncbi:MAG TPA: hypothetical protein VFL31_04330, partial [Nitrospiraceae bacterium]|nr:hypothetical protein [Nitrospiraceae bacterium]